MWQVTHVRGAVGVTWVVAVGGGRRSGSEREGEERRGERGGKIKVREIKAEMRVEAR